MAVRTLEESAERLLSFDELRAQLRAVGEERYHHQHPFHLLMHEGRLSRGQLQAWALNRYYYQSMIPIKDSIILSRRHRSGVSPRLAQARHRSRWRRSERRRNQALAEARRSDGTRSPIRFVQEPESFPRPVSRSMNI